MKASQFRWAVGVMALCSVACEETRGTAASGASPSAQPTAAPTTAAPQDASVDRVYGGFLGGLDARTGLDVNPSFILSWHDPAGQGPTAAVVDDISKRLRLRRREDAAEISVVVAVESGDLDATPVPTTAPRVRITPGGELEADTWYEFYGTSDERLAIEGGQAGQPWALPFFTGSAPFVTRVIVSELDAQLFMSEAVDISTLGGPAIVDARGGALSGCLMLGPGCARTQPAGTWMNAFAVAVARPDAVIGGAAVQLGALRGQRRTVAESSIAGRTDPTPIEASEWTQLANGQWEWHVAL